MPWDRALVCLLAAAAAPALAGCVSSAAYEAALIEAKTARVAAARSEAETRALEATVTSLSRRLDAQEPSDGEVRSALELVRSLRALGLLNGRVADQIRRACETDPSPASAPANATVPGAPRSPKPTVAAHRPLDHDDPWSAGPRAALARPVPVAKSTAVPALDAGDPWPSAKRTTSPPLDASDPW